MTAAPPPRGRNGTAIRTFLIADIRGWTGFTDEHGDEAASALARKFAEVAGEGVQAWGGRVVELRGDEVLAVFESGRDALRAAAELQAAFAAETRIDPSLPLPVGIGLDAGEAVPVGDGFRGAALNVAARLCSLAAASETIATRSLRQLAGPLPGLDFVALPPTKLKGLREPVDAVRVEATGEPARSLVQTERQPDQREPPDVHPSPSDELGDGLQPPLPAELEAIVPLAGRSVELRSLGWHWRRAGHGAGRTIVDLRPAGYRQDAPGGGARRPCPCRRGDRHVLRRDRRHRRADQGVGGNGQEACHRRRSRRRAPVRRAQDERRCRARQRDADAAAVDAPGGGGAAAALARRTARAAIATPAAGSARAGCRARHRRPVCRSGGRSGPDRRDLRPKWRRAGSGAPLGSAWARDAAAARLEASARRTSDGRRRLRAAQDELIGDVADLEFVARVVGALRRRPNFRRRAVPGRGRAPGRLPLQGPRRLRRRRCRVLLRPGAARRRAGRAARRGFLPRPRGRFRQRQVLGPPRRAVARARGRRAARLGRLASAHHAAGRAPAGGARACARRDAR